ncbi:MAG TPA: beta-N-acetylhexosaminidase [Bacteroidales bacterium]|nr:beta-N-acetylhexosaminidase [Bacteroidales bacterium]
MKKSLFSIIAILFLVTGCKSGVQVNSTVNYAIIPAPVSLIELKGDFVFTAKSRIILSTFNDETRLAADFLSHLVANPTGFRAEVAEGNKPESGSVFMMLDTAIKNNEGYLLTITPKKIIIKAKSAPGLFYAVQTIRQLMPTDVEKPLVVKGFRLAVPACEIKDAPRFAYRGMHLDVCRHFFPPEDVKRYIDMIALNKMNTFHWHLTDDQGWRIEIKKYPGLIQVGAFRKETLVGHGGKQPFVYDGKPYGGFYTQDEIRDIVAYARSKFVTIIPEIEMPGHALAALAAYPGLSCTGGPFDVYTRWGVVDDVYCAGKDETFNFLEDVLTEVTGLFPGKYIHIGGDECPKTRWEKCPLCQKRIKVEGLKDEQELQSYFIQRIEKFLNSKGRKIIGWDEILEGGLAPEATVMSWRGTDAGIAAAQQKHNVIMTPGQYVYLDHYQCEPADQPLAIGGYLPLEQVYSFNPLPSELTPDEQKYILGIQGNVWTEYIGTRDYLDYMTYPRMFAIAETGWTPDRLKDFDDFLARFEVLKKRYDVMGINYFKGEYRDVRAVK